MKNAITWLSALLLVACVTACACAAPVVDVPTLSGGTYQQTAHVQLGIDQPSKWYWAYHSQSEGTHFFRATSVEPPSLNDSNPVWQEIQWDTWVDELSEWGQYGGPETVSERAYLTDTMAYLKSQGNFTSAYWYLGWSDALNDLKAHSVLYGD